MLTEAVPATAGQECGPSELYEEFLRAARYGELELVAELFPSIKEQADLALLPRALSALHMAAGNGHVDVVQYLADHGLDINAANLEGNTPLHWAALNGHLPMVKCLVERGADVSLKNKHGKTAAFEAQRAHYEDIVNLLIEASYYGEQEEREIELGAGTCPGDACSSDK